MVKGEIMTNILGLMLFDAPHSALNNSGNDPNAVDDNIVKTKSFWKNGKVYPYVSGQAFRYWWRNILEKKYGWVMSPITKVKDKSVAFTSANPVDFPDDDIFGYMRAIKNGKGFFAYLDENDELVSEEVTLSSKDGATRLAPLKNTPLVSVVGSSVTGDFGVMARHEGDPVPYNHEFYSTILKGAFSLNLDDVGMFYRIDRSGFRNIPPKLIELFKENPELSSHKKLDTNEKSWVLDDEIRLQRSKDIISSLPYLYGGAKLSSHLTDVSPKFIFLLAIDGGNNIILDIIHEKDGKLFFDEECLKETLRDYNDIILTDLYIGIRVGFLPEYYDVIYALNDKKLSDIVGVNLENLENKKVHVGSVKKIVDEFSSSVIPELMRE